MLHATSQYYKVALVNQKSTLMELWGMYVLITTTGEPHNLEDAINDKKLETCYGLRIFCFDEQQYMETSLILKR
jgi:hypothetical protein